MARERERPLFQHLMFKVEILCTQHIGQGGWEVWGDGNKYNRKIK